MKTIVKSQNRSRQWSGPLAGVLRLLLTMLAVGGESLHGQSVPYQVYDDKGMFLAQVRCAQVVTQGFGGFSAGANLNGREILPGVTVTSSFDSLVIWHDANLFGYDNHTRVLGQGAYEFRLSGYNAVGFDIMAWDPRAPGPAKATIYLEDGTAYQIERWQRGATEQTPVFFGVTANQPIVRLRWAEGPEVYGGGNEEVSLDNLLCARTQPCETPLEGTWEPDTYTGHASRLVIRQDTDHWTIHGYGACSPTSCDWGETILHRVQPHNEGAFDGWFAVWEFAFVTTYAWLTSEDQGLKVETIDVFHDSSGRQPYSMLSQMHRLRSNTVALARSAVGSRMVVRVVRDNSMKLQRCSDLSCSQWVDIPLADGQFEYVISGGGPIGFFRLFKP